MIINLIFLNLEQNLSIIKNTANTVFYSTKFYSAIICCIFFIFEQINPPGTKSGGFVN